MMKEKTVTHKQKAKHSLVMPSHSVPELITTCPKCGGEIELWSEDEETSCIFCGHKLFERETTTH